MPPRRAPARGAAAARGASNNDDSIAVDVNAMNIKIEAGETTPEAPQMKYDQAPIQADPTVPQAPMTAQADGNAPVANMMGPPASTASRPPVQRLASLRGRAATRGARGASTSASASSSPAPEGAAGAPKPAPAKTRFRPKAAVRKTAEEREALAAEEAARVANEERAANRGRGRGRGGRGRGGRGRGDARMGGERIVTGTATGIFSQMSDSRKFPYLFYFGKKKF